MTHAAGLNYAIIALAPRPPSSSLWHVTMISLESHLGRLRQLATYLPSTWAGIFGGHVGVLEREVRFAKEHARGGGVWPFGRVGEGWRSGCGAVVDARGMGACAADPLKVCNVVSTI